MANLKKEVEDLENIVYFASEANADGTPKNAPESVTEGSIWFILKDDTEQE